MVSVSNRKVSSKPIRVKESKDFPTGGLVEDSKDTVYVESLAEAVAFLKLLQRQGYTEVFVRDSETGELIPIHNIDFLKSVIVFRRSRKVTGF